MANLYFRVQKAKQYMKKWGAEKLLTVVVLFFTLGERLVSELSGTYQVVLEQGSYDNQVVKIEQVEVILSGL